MPAAWFSVGRYSVRNASMTMSWVAEAVATITAASATIHGEATGSCAPRNSSAAMSKSCVNTNQPRRWPSTRPSTGI